MFLFRYFDTDFIREALKSRLSLGMTSNKTYHFQTTANHHRFIKVWTSIADLPTSNFFVQTFFWKKYGSEIPYLPMIWTYVQIFVVFFFWISLLSSLQNSLGHKRSRQVWTDGEKPGQVGIGRGGPDRKWQIFKCLIFQFKISKCTMSKT